LQSIIFKCTADEVLWGGNILFGLLTLLCPMLKNVKYRVRYDLQTSLARELNLSLNPCC